MTKDEIDKLLAKSPDEIRKIDKAKFDEKVQVDGQEMSFAECAVRWLLDYPFQDVEPLVKGEGAVFKVTEKDEFQLKAYGSKKNEHVKSRKEEAKQKLQALLEASGDGLFKEDVT